MHKLSPYGLLISLSGGCTYDEPASFRTACFPQLLQPHALCFLLNLSGHSDIIRIGYQYGISPRQTHFPADQRSLGIGAVFYHLYQNRHAYRRLFSVLRPVIQTQKRILLFPYVNKKPLQRRNRIFHGSCIYTPYQTGFMRTLYFKLRKDSIIQNRHGSFIRKTVQ